ncbi:hypothetical protein H4R23_004346, partial [Coemansia sp. Cherry 401B]
ESPSTQLSPAVPRHSPPAAAHSLPAIRSPGMPPLQPMPPPQLQPAQAQQQYYPDTLSASAAPQYTYYPHQHQQQHNSQQQPPPPQHVPTYSQSAGMPASSSAAGAAPVQPRLLSTATSNPQSGFSNHQLGLVAQACPPTTSASANSASPAAVAVSHGQLPQQFVSPHGIPTSLLGHGSAVANADYGVWFYPHQQLPQVDRSAAGGGGIVNSASVSPISQHTIASTDQSYPLQGQFDSQMRYMAVPGHASGLPKPIASATLPIDRSLRPISAVGQQQHGLAAMQYQNPHYPGQAQYHASYYHQQHPPHPQSLHQHIFSGQHQHSQPQSQQIQQQQQHQQPSPFPAQPSALSATAPMSDSSSTQTSIGAPSSGSVVHAGAYGAADSISSDHVSAAQVAAAVAAAAASAHTIPVSSTSVSGPGPGGVMGLGSGRLGISLNEVEQPGMSAFKFSMGMQSGAESGIPEYFESYSQNYMMGNPPLLEPSPASPTEQTLDADLMVKLDELFMKYLEAICSNSK